MQGAIAASKAMISAMVPDVMLEGTLFGAAVDVDEEDRAQYTKTINEALKKKTTFRPSEEPTEAATKILKSMVKENPIYFPNGFLAQEKTAQPATQSPRVGGGRKRRMAEEDTCPQPAKRQNTGGN